MGQQNRIGAGAGERLAAIRKWVSFDTKKFIGYPTSGLDGFNLPVRKNGHFQQKPPVAKTAYVGAAIGSFAVTNGDFNDLKILFYRAENQIKVSKGVKIPEIASIILDFFIILAKQGFGAAERVFELLIKDPGEHKGEKFIPK